MLYGFMQPLVPPAQAAWVPGGTAVTLDGLLGSVGTTFTINTPSNMAMQHHKTVFGITQFQQPKNTKVLSKCWGKLTHHSFLSTVFVPAFACGLKGRQPGATSKFNDPTKTKKKQKTSDPRVSLIIDASLVFLLFFTGSTLGEFQITVSPEKKKSRLCTLGKSFWRRRLTMEEVWNWKNFLGMNCFFWHLPSFEIEKTIITKYKLIIVSKLKTLKCLLSFAISYAFVVLHLRFTQLISTPFISWPAGLAFLSLLCCNARIPLPSVPWRTKDIWGCHICVMVITYEKCSSLLVKNGILIYPS